MGISSSEAEYRALAAATWELQCLMYLFKYLHIKCIKTLVLYCDNQSALHIAVNHVFRERTKHLKIDCHIVSKKMMAGLMKLLPCSSNDQLTDFFTKPLLPQPFNVLLSKLAMLDIYQSSTCERILQDEDDDNDLKCKEANSTCDVIQHN